MGEINEYIILALENGGKNITELFKIVKNNQSLTQYGINMWILNKNVTKLIEQEYIKKVLKKDEQIYYLKEKGKQLLKDFKKD